MAMSFRIAEPDNAVVPAEGLVIDAGKQGADGHAAEYVARIVHSEINTRIRYEQRPCNQEKSDASVLEQQ